MKVLIVCSSQFGYNGIASVILNYYRAMEKDNIQMDFVVINDDIEMDIKSEFEKNNSKLYVLSTRKSSTFTYIKELTNILKENKYDILHAHGNSATLFFEMLAGKRAGIKVRIAHSHNTTCQYKKAHKILKPLFRMMYTNGFACSKVAGKWLFGNKEYIVINNGIDTEKFCYKQELREKLRKEMSLENKIVVGHVGVFNYQKNHEKLIGIFDKIRRMNEDTVLLLIGEGELKSTIKEKVERMGISSKVIFVDKTSEVEKYMHIMDVFVLPSRFEGLPVVLVEAQAVGLPCIVSNNVSEEANITGLVKFIDSEENDKVYAEAILDNIGDELIRKTNAKMANDLIKKRGYSIKENAKYEKELYETLLKK